MNIYTLQNNVNNDYRMGSREREERSRRARRGGGREGERERGRGREGETKKRNKKNIDMLTSMRGVLCPPHAPVLLM